MDIEQLRAIDRDLKNRNEYVYFKHEDYKEKEGNSSLAGWTFVILATFFGFLCFLMAQEGESVDFGGVFGVTVILSGAISSLLYWITTPHFQNEELKEMKAHLDQHNRAYVSSYMENWKNEQLKEFTNIDKEIEILNKHTTYWNEIKKIIIDDNSKMFHYLQLGWHTTKLETNKNLKSCQYSEILKYEVVDKTTSKQIATSTTSSNSGKALGGAIIGELLFDEAAAGAVVGGSGKRTTNTTYETKYSRNYDVNIFLDRLNDSIIKINTKSKDKVSEIVSVLEYILKSNA